MSSRRKDVIYGLGNREREKKVRVSLLMQVNSKLLLIVATGTRRVLSIQRQRWQRSSIREQGDGQQVE
jgi:hypothetical protein